MAKSKKKNTFENVTIIVSKPHNVVGDTETVVSVNGKMYQIMYDTPVEVPRNVADVINQSREMQLKIIEATENLKYKPGKPALAEL